MTKLATNSDVRDVIRFSDIGEVNTSIDSALEVATSNLETDLRLGSLTRATRFDIFFVKHKEIHANLFEYHWRLSRGFIDSSETFTVRVADQIRDFGVSDSDITEDAIIGFERGIVSIVGGQLSTIRVAQNNSRIIGNFVRIDYTSGIKNVIDPEFFDPDDVPTFLKEAAVLNAIFVLDTIDPNLRAEGDSKTDAKATGLMYKTMIQQNIRYFPKYDSPVVKS